MKGKLIIFEGIDGSGKSTVLDYVVQYLEKRGISYVITKEPGSPYIPECKEIRRELLDPNIEKTPEEELKLFIEDRSIHYSQLVIPKLKEGVWVLCDRGPSSTIAYQCYGGNVDLDLARKLNREATQGIIADLTFLLDVDPKIAYKRLLNRGNKSTWFEEKRIDFFKKVRDGYLREIKENKESYGKVVIIDASKKLEDVLGDVERFVSNLVN